MFRRSIIRMGNAYFGSRWRVVPFQPVLYALTGLATIHVSLTDNESIGFDRAFGGTWFHYVWVILGLFAPLQLACSILLINKYTGKRRYRGYWFRLSADVAQFTTLTTFLMAWLHSPYPIADSDYRMFLLFILVAAIIFVGELIIRDIWKLVLIERVANSVENEAEAALVDDD